MNKLYAFAEKKSFDDDEMSIVAYGSVEEVDRHNEMILASAWTDEGLKTYREKNPVILINHNYYELPVGRAMWVKADEDGLKFKIQFANTETGKEMYSLYKGSFMNSFSVGFRPVAWYDNEKEQKYADKNGKVPYRVYTECELLELSCVSIPASPSSTMIRSFKSFVDHEFQSQELKEYADKVKLSEEYIEIIKSLDGEDEVFEKPKVVGFIDLEKQEEKKVTIEIEIDGEEVSVEETPNEEPEDSQDKIEVTDGYIHVPVLNASLFTEGTFRTINISVEKGIKAVIGKLNSGGNTKIQKYMFDAEKWNVSDAEVWVKAHKMVAEYIEKEDSTFLKYFYQEGVLDTVEDSFFDLYSVEEIKSEEEIEVKTEEKKEEIDIEKLINEKIDEKLKFYKFFDDKLDKIIELLGKESENVSPEIEVETTKSGEIEVEIVEKSSEVEIDIDVFTKSMTKSIENAIKNAKSGSEILEERFKKFKGEIF